MSNLLSAIFKMLRMAIAALIRWPLRTALTSFGILVGVAAVTVTVALGEGTRRKVAQDVESLGSTALQVQAQASAVSGALAEEGKARLTEGDGSAIERQLAEAGSVAPLLTSMEQVVAGQENVTAEVTGTTRALFGIRAWQLSSGVFWNDTAESTGERVCVLGQTLRDELFGAQDPVGRVLRVGRHPFRVVGLLAPKGQGSFGRDQDAVLFMPIKAARSKLRPAKFGVVDTLLVAAKSADVAPRLQGSITSLLRQRHGLAEGVRNDFRVRSQGRFVKMQKGIVDAVNVLLVSIALVSLVVGGVGIMNIMLVSVSERTREIGIRLAVGARARDIWLQFLVEATVLSFLGGALGALLAVGATELLANALELPMSVSPLALLTALSISVSMGVLFGFLPARRAAALDPIEALSRD